MSAAIEDTLDQFINQDHRHLSVYEGKSRYEVLQWPQEDCERRHEARVGSH